MISEPVVTADGSLTCRHPVYRETYHAVEGARSEAVAKFILPSRLEERLSSGPVRLLDVGFGLGVNCRVAVDTARRIPGSCLILHTLEADPEAWVRARGLYPECRVTERLAEAGHCCGDGMEIFRHDGDIRQTLSGLPGPYDLIFHDPFSPMKNTECWTVDLFRRLFERLHPDGMLLTYSESAAVRAGLLQAGFHLGTSPAVPPHRGGTVAARKTSLLNHPVDSALYGVFPKNIPFRDPDLQDSGQAIRARREAEVRRGSFTPDAQSGTGPSNISR
jgi:hypothetical protein